MCNKKEDRQVFSPLKWSLNKQQQQLNVVIIFFNVQINFFCCRCIFYAVGDTM